MAKKRRGEKACEAIAEAGRRRRLKMKKA